jgi:hypothetical protein
VSVYKRGDVWWYKFVFNGQVIRESAKTNSKNRRGGSGESAAAGD